MTKWWIVPFAWLLTTLVPCAAHADALPMPPKCEGGAVGMSSHSGTYCGPWTCASDDECGRERSFGDDTPRVCRTTGLCQHDEEYTVSTRIRLPPDAAPQRATRTVAAEPCDSDHPSCKDDRDKCIVAKYCAPPATTPTPTPTSTTTSTTTSTATPGTEPTITVEPTPVPPRRSGCGCGVTTTTNALGGLAVIACVAGALAARRRRS